MTWHPGDSVWTSKVSFVPLISLLVFSFTGYLFPLW